MQTSSITKVNLDPFFQSSKLARECAFWAAAELGVNVHYVMGCGKSGLDQLKSALALPTEHAPRVIFVDQDKDALDLMKGKFKEMHWPEALRADFVVRDYVDYDYVSGLEHGDQFAVHFHFTLSQLDSATQRKAIDNANKSYRCEAVTFTLFDPTHPAKVSRDIGYAVKTGTDDKDNPTFELGIAHSKKDYRPKTFGKESVVVLQDLPFSKYEWSLHSYATNTTAHLGNENLKDALVLSEGVYVVIFRRLDEDKFLYRSVTRWIRSDWGSCQLIGALPPSTALSKGRKGEEFCRNGPHLGNVIHEQWMGVHTREQCRRMGVALTELAQRIPNATFRVMNLRGTHVQETDQYDPAPSQSQQQNGDEVFEEPAPWWSEIELHQDEEPESESSATRLRDDSDFVSQIGTRTSALDHFDPFPFDNPIAEEPEEEEPVEVEQQLDVALPEDMSKCQAENESLRIILPLEDDYFKVRENAASPDLLKRVLADVDYLVQDVDQASIKEKGGSMQTLVVICGYGWDNLTASRGNSKFIRKIPQSFLALAKETMSKGGQNHFLVRVSASKRDEVGTPLVPPEAQVNVLDWHQDYSEFVGPIGSFTATGTNVVKFADNVKDKQGRWVVRKAIQKKPNFFYEFQGRYRHHMKHRVQYQGGVDITITMRTLKVVESASIVSIPKVNQLKFISAKGKAMAAWETAHGKDYVHVFAETDHAHSQLAAVGAKKDDGIDYNHTHRCAKCKTKRYSHTHPYRGISAEENGERYGNDCRVCDAAAKKK